MRARHFILTLLPTMFGLAHADYVRPVSLTPIGHKQTQLCEEWLFAAATLSSAGFNLKKVVKFATMVFGLDAAACQMDQRGFGCARFERGRLMPEDFEVLRFQQWARARTA